MASVTFYKFGVELQLREQDYDLLLDYCIDSGLSIDELLWQFVREGIEDLRLSSL